MRSISRQLVYLSLTSFALTIVAPPTFVIRQGQNCKDRGDLKLKVVDGRLHGMFYFHKFFSSVMGKN